MKFKTHIAFPILTFHHQHFTRYPGHLVCHHNFFFIKTAFDSSAAEPQQAIN